MKIKISAIKLKKAEKFLSEGAGGSFITVYSYIKDTNYYISND